MSKLIQRRKKINAGMNGFGRFGLHMLKYWLDRRDEANFNIKYINDPFLTIDDALEIIKSDKAVIFFQYKFKIEEDNLLISSPHALNNRKIIFTTQGNKELNEINWVCQPELVLECSGFHAEYSEEARETFITNKTKNLVISATAPGADKTLVYGFNHRDFNLDTDKVISYGSCTVNAFVPLAEWMNNTFGILDAEVYVVHNVPGYKLKMLKNQVLYRKECTLEVVAPKLLEFLPSNRFFVDYVVCPFTNVSGITLCFGLKKEINKETFLASFKESLNTGYLNGLYGLEKVDVGDSNRYTCTPFSAVFTEDNIKLRGNKIYLQGYFDTEASTNRYYELVDYISNLQLKAVNEKKLLK